MRDCGAVPKTSLKVDEKDTITNAQALTICLERANNDEGNRKVLIPKGFAFSSTASKHANLTAVTL